MGIDLGIREQQFTDLRIERAVVEHEVDLHGVLRNTIEFTGLQRAAQMIEFGHRLREVGIDRIELLDGR